MTLKKLGVGIEKDRGEYMSEGLRPVLQDSGFSFVLLRAAGAICTDVEYGAEIETMRLLGAKKVIACETGKLLSGTPKENFKFEIIEALGKSVDLRVIKEPARPALRVLNQEIPRVQAAIITWLNVHPEILSPQNVAGFVEDARSLLEPDGRVVVSVRESPDFACGWLTQAALILRSEEIKSEVIVAKKRKLAGQVLLVATPK